VTTYQVPKDQARALLNFPPHEDREVVLFLSTSAEHHHGQETVSDLFRSTSPFLPLKTAEGQPLLVRKKAVRFLQIKEPERVEWTYYELREGAPKRRIRLCFGDGACLEGFIFATTPEGHQRVSDVINLTGPFMHLEADEGLYLVNLGHVSSISIVEEPRGGA
jgi:hypothetical protein